MTLEAFIYESTSGKPMASFTNEEYGQVSTEETDPEIKEIFKDYSNVI